MMFCPKCLKVFYSVPNVSSRAYSYYGEESFHYS